MTPEESPGWPYSNSKSGLKIKQISIVENNIEIFLILT